MTLSEEIKEELKSLDQTRPMDILTAKQTAKNILPRIKKLEKENEQLKLVNKQLLNALTEIIQDEIKNYGCIQNDALVGKINIIEQITGKKWSEII